MFRILRQPHPSGAAFLGRRQRRTHTRRRPGQGPRDQQPGRNRARVGQGALRPRRTTRGPGVASSGSQLEHNPHLDPDYINTLAVLPHAERDASSAATGRSPDDGDLFQRAWFDLIERHQLPEQTRALRFWDLARDRAKPR